MKISSFKMEKSVDFVRNENLICRVSCIVWAVEYRTGLQNSIVQSTLSLLCLWILNTMRIKNNLLWMRAWDTFYFSARQWVVSGVWSLLTKLSEGEKNTLKLCHLVISCWFTKLVERFLYSSSGNRKKKQIRFLT